MKRRGKYFITILVIIAIVALGIMYIFSKNTTFKEVVLDKLNLLSDRIAQMRRK